MSVVRSTLHTHINTHTHTHTHTNTSTNHHQKKPALLSYIDLFYSNPWIQLLSIQSFWWEEEFCPETVQRLGASLSSNIWGFIYFNKLLTMSLGHVFNLSLRVAKALNLIPAFDRTFEYEHRIINVMVHSQAWWRDSEQFSNWQILKWKCIMFAS